MKIRNYREQFPLNAEAIDRFSELLEETLSQIEMERQNRYRIRLSMEEALLRMRDRFGEEAVVTASIVRHIGRLVIQVEKEGEPFNPLSMEESEMEDLCTSLLTAVGLSPQYSYAGGKNNLRLSLSLPGINPAFAILIALIGGVLIGLLGKGLFSGSLQESTIQVVMNPIYELWLRILNVMSGPVIFFMVITTILDVGKISERGGNFKHLVARYFLLSLLMATFSMIMSALVFPLQGADGASSEGLLSRVMEEILRIMPKDFFSPFINTDTPQLLVMALVLGGALNIIGTRARNLSRVIHQINMVGLLLCKWISRLVPFFACILIGLEIWQGRTMLLEELWKCILLAFAVSIVCIAAALVRVGVNKKSGVAALGRKLWGPFRLTIRTGTLDASYGLTEECCARELGIHPEFTSFSLPNGLVLYMPISAVGTIVFIVYAAMKYGVTTTPMWYVAAVILSVILFVATPPVPGANLLAYTAIFLQLGLPKEALIDAMLFDIVFGIFAAASNQLVLQLELIMQADRIGMLKRDTLQKSIR